ncbi:MAG: hypothetical protein AMXMBFR64_33080 [Myxococcales bacterium]
MDLLALAFGIVAAASTVYVFLLRKELLRVRSELEPLRKYEVVRNAEERARQVIEEATTRAADETRRARAAADQLIVEAQTRKSAAERDAGRLMAEAEQRARHLIDDAAERSKDEIQRARLRAEQLGAEAQRQVAAARADANRIIDEANVKAREIAGDAMDALGRVRELERTASALKNVIEGYGDQYLIPTHSLLDELAEEFGFTEAGQELKRARDRVRAMVKSKQTATCDYVEAVRRDTAIAFVTDAFNGKVDTILARAKNDNFGTLRQEILDAFTLVNTNGAAFRDARILPEFRDARIDELRWATVAQELKLKEREEQRAIKEHLREEERAQREFERALKEAAKEEELLKKAMEKVQKQVATATAEERARFEAQLQDLNQKLADAEARSQRALSMAQQTKSGHVYVISNIGSFGEHVYKIGMTRRLEPQDRVRELGDASVPFEFDVHALIYSDDAPRLERDLHRRFLRTQVNKVNPRKEFFRVPIAAIRSELDGLGMNTSWTMTAAAREYRETLAIEAAMEKNEFDESRWAESQVEAMEAEVLEAVEA